MTSALNDASLSQFSNQLRRPLYDRKMLKSGILHIGIGNFHRAHQAMYLHKLFNLQQDFDWAICGAGVKHFDSIMREKLMSQNWLSTIVELEHNKIQAEVCGSMIEFVDVNSQSVVQRMAQTDIKIVSLTITEGGYFIDEDSGNFDIQHPEIQDDIKHPGEPATVFGMIVLALKLRREAELGPFTVMSCDNIPHNGHVTKNAVLGIAQAIDKELADWISANVTFPNSMVDCIAPTVNDEQKAKIFERFGIRDNAPVMCESFRQWVLEDKFVAGRPQLEKVGVQFVDDVAPYELMKLRVLNGGHASLAYAAGLLQSEYVHEAMNQDLIVRYLDKLMTSEIIPSLPEHDDIDGKQYYELIKTRFSNPEIKDTIERLYQDGENRLPKFILPTIFDNLQNSKKVSGLALVIALWCNLLSVSTQTNNHIKLLNDIDSDMLQAANDAADNPHKFLGISTIFGPLYENTGFVKEFRYWLQKLNSLGIEKTLQLYLKEVYMRC